MNNIIEAELEKKMEEVNFDGDEVVVNNSQSREDIETQLIRKFGFMPECQPTRRQTNVLYCAIPGSLITSYFNITRKTVRDSVPKAIMHLLVNSCREMVQNRLVTALYKEDLFTELLQEDETLAAERQKCLTMLDMYKRAFTMISDAL